MFILEFSELNKLHYLFDIFRRKKIVNFFIEYVYAFIDFVKLLEIKII